MLNWKCENCSEVFFFYMFFSLFPTQNSYSKPIPKLKWIHICSRRIDECKKNLLHQTYEPYWWSFVNRTHAKTISYMQNLDVFSFLRLDIIFVCADYFRRNDFSPQTNEICTFLLFSHRLIFPRKKWSNSEQLIVPMEDGKRYMVMWAASSIDNHWGEPF